MTELNKYKKLEPKWGENLATVVNELLKYKTDGILACADFNGHTLYSDTVNMDDAYKLITGLSFEEFKRELDRFNH